MTSVMALAKIDMMDLIEASAIFAVGLFAWTFLEYLIHGWLSHICGTFIGRLHAVHHRNPRAVFTVRAWAPLAVIWALLVTFARWSPGTIFFAGMTAGFIAYEVVHYRIHFRHSPGTFETWLRERHLIHHRREPQRCLGVTSPLWDLIFETEPLARMKGLRESVAATPPISGRTNICLHNFLPFRPPAER